MMITVIYHLYVLFQHPKNAWMPTNVYLNDFFCAITASRRLSLGWKTLPPSFFPPRLCFRHPSFSPLILFPLIPIHNHYHCDLLRWQWSPFLSASPWLVLVAPAGGKISGKMRWNTPRIFLNNFLFHYGLDPTVYYCSGSFFHQRASFSDRSIFIGFWEASGNLK